MRGGSLTRFMLDQDGGRLTRYMLDTNGQRGGRLTRYTFGPNGQRGGRLTRYTFGPNGQRGGQWMKTLQKNVKDIGREALIGALEGIQKKKWKRENSRFERFQRRFKKGNQKEIGNSRS